MPAGPYPTKVMHEALKTRVDTLENAPGGGSAPERDLWLSDFPAMATAGSRDIGPGEYPEGGLVRKATITFTASAPSVTVEAMRNGFSMGYAALGVNIFSSQSALDQNNPDVLSEFYVEGADAVWLDTPVVLGPGNIVVLDYGQLQSLANLPFRADPVLPQGVTYNALVVTDGGTPIPGLSVGLPVEFIRSGNVYGSLAPWAMNVRPAPSTLANGDFEIVDPGNAAPTLRYRASSGTVYRLAMTPEV